MSSSKHKTVELDAAAERPGRLASKIAMLLMGKHKTKYDPHIDFGDRVVITNIKKMVFSGKKLDQKIYRHHSMHPGGLKEVPAKKILTENPEQVLKSAVMKMLPKNKLRTQRMLRIVFK